jgi:Uma2 family endonuclease
MVAERKQPAITVEEYLAQEAVSQIKHEYVHGYVYAMAGGTLDHDTIANNLRNIIFNHLGDGPCRINGPDVRVRVEQAIYYYPDAVVTCDDTLSGTAIEVTAPRLIIEVLSDSTEAVDRGGKFADYQALPMLAEYLLVDSRRRIVERYHRADHNRWLYERSTADDSITLESIGLTCSVAAFYRHTNVES